MDRKSIAGDLLGWYRANRRDLPWRRGIEPYGVWVSEIMLQQTRVSTVIPYYERFLERFPTVEALAAAAEQSLLEAWAGLGYYRRARQLQQAAISVVERHGGEFPRTHDAIRALPGIGDYTAAAIAGIAFELPHAAVDGNVLRVISRIYDDSHDIAKGAGRRELGAKAQALLETLGRGSYGDFNQALMELGALVCTPRSPRCLMCPVQRRCLSRKRGTQAQRPVKNVEKRVERLELAVALVRRNGRVLLRQRPPDSGVMPGFWEMPQAEAARLEPDCFAELGIRRGERLGRFRHGITFRSYEGSVYEGTIEGQRPEEYRWTPPARLDSLPLTTITRKSLLAAGVLRTEKVS